MAWKYIMIKSRGRVIPVIFSDILVHEDVASLILNNVRTVHNDLDGTIYSAGEVSVDIMANHHGSKTLNIKYDRKQGGNRF